MAGHVLHRLEQLHPHASNRQQLGPLLGIFYRIGACEAVEGSPAVIQSGELHGSVLARYRQPLEHNRVPNATGISRESFLIGQKRNTWSNRNGGAPRAALPTQPPLSAMQIRRLMGRPYQAAPGRFPNMIVSGPVSIFRLSERVL